jgi:hypothetical protein
MYHWGRDWYQDRFCRGSLSEFKSNFRVYLVPEAADHGLSCHRVAPPGVVILERNGFAAAKNAPAASRQQGDALGHAVVFNYTKSKAA